ncbi:MAG: tetratricopeptide repeat protein [Pyrinomonadaceae bacterium]|nr:tetratricopeptide repeat protein [Chloracidobacterium sp.]MBP9936200.1 tetratricopeptide repeat protein [Pyrinomonadaceae bacterium]
MDLHRTGVPNREIVRRTLTLALLVIVMLFFGEAIRAQADDMCREFGETPSRESGRDNRLVPFVFGRVTQKGTPIVGKQPRITAIYSDSVQPATRQIIGRSGNYCFQKLGSGGTLVIEVDGVEVARKSVFDSTNTKQREDFDIYPPGSPEIVKPGVLNANFARPSNPKTAELYQKAGEAEKAKDTPKAIEIVRAIVAADPEDFIAWAKLGSLYIGEQNLADAETAFKRSFVIRPDYAPAILNLGIISGIKGLVPAAIDYFERAVVADPGSASAYRLLGEAYLQARRGNDGLAALDEALRIDPKGMAECHLMKARLYDLAGAKNLAAAEYKAFLAKVKDHPDRKKFEKYVKENSAK